jgi:hypothetical protein
MGAAYYIVLEREIDGLDTMMDGKALSRHMETLDETAQSLGVRPLSDFFSMAPEDIADVLGDADIIKDSRVSLEQYSAQDGLATIRVLLAQPEAQPALHDLKECERVLAIAAEHNVGWHFQIDI